MKNDYRVKGIKGVTQTMRKQPKEKIVKTLFQAQKQQRELEKNGRWVDIPEFRARVLVTDGKTDAQVIKNYEERMKSRLKGMMVAEGEKPKKKQNKDEEED